MEGGTSDLSCIIPTKILEELKIILGARKGEKKPSDKTDKKEKDVVKASSLKVEATMSKQQIEFQIGSTHLLSRLIDGKFPDYEQIIPKDTKTKVLFSTQELLVATRRMHYFAKEMNNNLTFHITKGQARVITPQTQAGRDEASFIVEKSGDDNKIALSSSYLLDFLGHTGDSNVEMRIVDSVHPAVFVAPQTPHCLHLIMPLRMQEE